MKRRIRGQRVMVTTAVTNVYGAGWQEIGFRESALQALEAVRPFLHEQILTTSFFRAELIKEFGQVLREVGCNHSRRKYTYSDSGRRTSTVLFRIDNQNYSFSGREPDPYQRCSIISTDGYRARR